MKFRIGLYIITAFTCIYANAKIKTNAIFSDNMMLQQGSARIWGTSEPKAKLEIEIAGKKSLATADADGKWSALIKTPKGSQKTYEVKLYENGKLSKTIKNVLVGEIWIAGGQSNMDFGLKNVQGSKKYIENADKSNVRFFVEGSSSTNMFSAAGIGKNPESEFPQYSRWVLPDAKNAGGLSGVAYIFAAEYAKKIKIPVGIVYTGTSGTKMAAWVSRETYDNSEFFKKERENFQERLKKYDFKKEKAKFDEEVRTYDERVKKAQSEGKTPPAAWTVAPFMSPWPDSPDKWSTPSMLFNLRINPLRNYGARGVVWYQGESDSHDGFAQKFEGLINEWRKHFNNPKMPFIFVQLPSYNGWKWELNRAEQEKIAKKLKNTIMVCAIDTGEENDVHPHDKIAIGKRLAAAVAAKSGRIFPSVKKVRIEGEKARVNFNYRRGLVLKGDCRGFEMLINGKWIAADAKFNNNAIFIKTPDKTQIKGVRYLWKPWAKPDVCLFDTNGNPVPPFSVEE